MIKYWGLMLVGFLFSLNVYSIQHILWEVYQILADTLGVQTSEEGFKVLTIFAVFLFLCVFVRGLKR